MNSERSWVIPRPESFSRLCTATSPPCRSRGPISQTRGTPFFNQFRFCPARPGIAATARLIGGPYDRDAAVRERAADPDNPPIVFAMIETGPLLMLRGGCMH
jgi:hypothetical protein